MPPTPDPYAAVYGTARGGEHDKTEVALGEHSRPCGHPCDARSPLPAGAPYPSSVCPVCGQLAREARAAQPPPPPCEPEPEPEPRPKGKTLRRTPREGSR